VLIVLSNKSHKKLNTIYENITVSISLESVSRNQTLGRSDFCPELEFLGSKVLGPLAKSTATLSQPFTRAPIQQSTCGIHHSPFRVNKDTRSCIHTLARGEKDALSHLHSRA